MIAGERARGIAPGIANARRTTSERRTQSVGVQAELALAKELGLKIGSIIPGRAVVVECEAYQQETQVEEVCR